LVSVISTLYVYANLQEERQLIILKSSGLDNFKLAKPALIIAIIISILSFFISFYLLPKSYGALKYQVNYFKDTYVSNIIEEKSFNQISKFLTLYVEKKLSNNELSGIALFDSKNQNEKTILMAKKGEIIRTEEGSTSFILSNGERHTYDSNNNLTRLAFDKLSVDLEAENQKDINYSKTSFELFISELLWPDKNLPMHKQNRLITEGHLRVVWPMFNFAYVLITLSIFLRYHNPRKVEIKQYIYPFIPVLLSSYYHFTMQKIIYLNLDYLFLCYLNIVVCIIFGMWQIKRINL
ncbi:MAG: LptF/LptG family permease, partial [Proteobacteria bacterium]|nr:LptF/LptG family permease [Pseudomonadota bacterium]